MKDNILQGIIVLCTFSVFFYLFVVNDRGWLYSPLYYSEGNAEFTNYTNSHHKVAKIHIRLRWGNGDVQYEITDTSGSVFTSKRLNKAHTKMIFTISDTL